VNREIVVHSLDHALAALAAAKSLSLPVTLASASCAAAQAGPGWFKALVDAARQAHPDVALTAILDCGDEPGAVMAALRAGLKQLRFQGDDELRQKLAAMGAEFLEPAGAVLDLRDIGNPAAACATFLGQR
jgi:hypothetical protein